MAEFLVVLRQKTLLRGYSQGHERFTKHAVKTKRPFQGMLNVLGEKLKRV